MNQKVSNNTSRSVAVIGAGITGLTAAFRLLQKGIPVTVYEAGARPGGVIHSVSQDGFLAEFGPNMIMETNPAVTALVRDAGLEKRRIYSSASAEKRFVVRNKKMQQVPTTLQQFLTTGLFSWRAKLNLLREPFVPPAPPEAEESVAQLVVRRLGQEFLDYAINPLVAGVYAGDPARLSVKHAFPKLHDVEQRYGSLIRGQVLGARERKRTGAVSKQNAPKFSFNGGLKTLIDALAGKLGSSLRLRHNVKRVTQRDDGWVLQIETPFETAEFSHSAVLRTSPAYTIADTPLDTVRGIDLSPLADIPYPPVASVVLGFTEKSISKPLNGFGMLVPEVEHLEILGCIFSSSIFPGRAPDGCVTLTSYLGGSRAPHLPFLDPDCLVELVCSDLQRILGISAKPIFRNVASFRRAIPQFQVGFGRFKSLMNEAEQKAPGLFLAGNFRDGISLGDAILSGHQASEKIETHYKSNSEQPLAAITA